jgi:hypothetical protein
MTQPTPVEERPRAAADETRREIYAEYFEAIAPTVRSVTTQLLAKHRGATDASLQDFILDCHDRFLPPKAPGSGG